MIDKSVPDDFQAEEERRRAVYNGLINTYSKQLFNFGYRFCPDGEIIKDCIQQLFLDLWNKNFDFDESSNIKSYLFRSIRNRILREKPKWNRNDPLLEEYNFILEFGIEKQLIQNDQDKELAGKLGKILNALPARQREIVYLKFYEDMDAGQISLIMNINRQSVHNLLQKAFQKMRVEWKDYCYLFFL